MFIPFQSTKGYRFTGLGLAVTYKIVSEHSSSIVVSSKLENGTTFKANLPIKEV